MKQPVFIRIYKDGQLVEVKQFDQNQIVIGRNDDAQVKLDDGQVSPVHAVIEERDSGYYISDLGSDSGTLVNGSKTFDEALESGDHIAVGPFKLEFFIGVPKPTQPPKSADLDPPKLTKKSSKAGGPPPVDKKKDDLPVADEPKPSFGSKLKSKLKSKLATELPTDLPSDVPTASSAAEKPRKKATAKQPNHGTFAPPSARNDLDSVMKPGSGATIEVVVAWKERILSSNHFSDKGTVTIGSSESCDIVLPLVGINLPKFELLKIDELAVVRVAPQMSGDFHKGKVTSSLAELQRQNRMVRTQNGFEMQLGQGEMIRLGLQGDAVSIYVRYVPETPKPLVAPVFDLTASEITGVVFSIVVAAIFGLYMLIYSPSSIDDEDKLEEKIRKATITFNRPKPKQVVKISPIKTKKKVVKVKKKSKKTVAKTKKRPGKAAQIKPGKVKKKKLGSARPGGSIKTGKKKAASAKSKQPDPSKIGILGVFGKGGTQKTIDKTFSGAGKLIGSADRATGYAGGDTNRKGDVLGTKLKTVGGGGKGSSTIGIAGVGTKGGKGYGDAGYGDGGLGERGRVDINVGGQDAEFVGTMDREAIRRVILNNKRAIKSCYDRALARDKNLYGKLVLQWDIEERGRVTNAKVKTNSLNNKQVANCIIRRLRGWRFPEPPPDQIGRVIYPFVFTSQ